MPQFLTKLIVNSDVQKLDCVLTLTILLTSYDCI